MGKCKDKNCETIKENICCAGCEKVNTCRIRCTLIVSETTIEDAEICPDYLDV